MAAISVQVPYPVFYDRDGDPLDNGNIYIGVANLDPVTNPIAVYYDEALTLPASQPLRTSNGYVYRNGTPAQLYVDAVNFSITVNDNKNLLVYSFPDGTGISPNASGIEYDPPFTGALTTGYTVSEKLSQTISIADFGAGEGMSASANTAAITAALTACGAQKAALYVPGVASSYLVNNEFTVPDGVTIYGDGYGSCIEQTVQGKNVFIAGDGNKFTGLRIKMCAGNNLDLAKQNCIYAKDIENIEVSSNWLQLVDINCGVQLDSVKNVIITNNIVYGATWPVSAGPAASAADILTYSFAPGGRIIISNNLCLSNNSQGIAIDLLGGDGDIVVDGNICVTLDPATCTLGGTWAEIANGGVRRHGIMVGYISSSVDGPRAVISNNICRNTRHTGIYKQGSASGPLIIEANMCSNNGYDTSVSLSGGIVVVLSGEEIVQNNYILDFKNTAGGTGGIAVYANVVPTKRTKISGNRVEGSLGVGILLTTFSALVDVTNNQLTANAGVDISWEPNAGDPGVGGHYIANNSTYRTSGTNITSINLIFQASTLTTVVRDNLINGNDNTTLDPGNSGVRVSAVTQKYLQLMGNKISKFYYGAYYNNYFAAARHNDTLIEGNVIQGCNTGFACAALTTNATVPLVDNRFVDVTTQTSGAALGSAAGRICTRLGEKLITQTTASPTLGEWAIGDRSVNSIPAVGQPKAWACTVAGAPGTWVSEGNL